MFLDSEQPSNQQNESPQTFTIQQYSLVITACTAQVSYGSELSFHQTKRPEISFYVSETKMGGVAAITPSFSFSSK